MRVAVVGPLADTLYEDWYSGTLPYAVTAYRGLVERLGADNVELVEGVDRIALRVGRSVVVAGRGRPAARPLRLAADATGAGDAPSTWSTGATACGRCARSPTAGT